MIIHIFPLVSKICEQYYSSGAGMGICSKRFFHKETELMAEKQIRFLKISVLYTWLK